MPRPTVYIAITNHGFGHATRTAAVAAAIQALEPDVLLFLVTTAPRWLLESYIPGDFIVRPRGFDVGVVQPDSLNLDKPATLAKWLDIQARAAAIIAAEATFIRQNQVDLVLGDIPPLAPAIAQAAGVPCWLMSNFGWDFIYRPWGAEFAELADWISALFAQTDRLWRYPWHEEMAAVPRDRRVDVGLGGGDPRYGLAELRDQFGLHTPRDRTILLTFGGLGLATIPYHNLAAFADWQFLTFDRGAPNLPNLIRLSDPRYRPVDVLPLCGRVISKPGFSTFSEACRQDTPIVTLTRQGFAEADLLMAGIQRDAHHQIIPAESFFNAPWDWLHEPVQPPQQPGQLRKDGTQTIATAVVEYLHRHV